MKCQKCKNRAVFEDLCKSCFSRYIERKIRRELRTSKLISRDDILVITDPLCEFVIKRALKGLPVKITKRGKGKRVLPWTVEDECHAFLSLFLNNKPLKGIGHGKDIKLFLTLREAEVSAYAKAKGFQFKARRKDTIMKVLDELEKKHSQTKYSLLRSINDIKKASEK
jgi:hypothetical protein